MAARRTTGIAGLDAQWTGGLPPGSVLLVLGEPMNAMDWLPAHFASGAAKAEGEALYATTDTPADQVMELVRAVGGADDAVTVVHLDGKAGGLPDVRADRRLVIDSISTWADGVGWDAAKAALVRLRDQAAKTGACVLVTALSDLHDARQKTWLKRWADGVMELGFDRQGFGLYPFLKVTKLRGVPDSARFLLFKETEKGLFIESTRRVF